MKLITELNYNVGSSIYEDANGEKFWYVEGIFAQAEVVNNNNRMYPKGILLRECNKFINEQINTNRAVGELNHPESPSINYENVTHKIESLEEDGNDFVGKARISRKGKGEIIGGLLEMGVTVAMSSRALGSVKKKNSIYEIQDNLMLRTFDIVSDPGAPEAFMNGIMENVEYKFLNDQIVAERVCGIIKEVHSTKSSDLEAKFLASFNEINKLVGRIK
mgnify:CR=1 FL=1